MYQFIAIFVIAIAHMSTAMDACVGPTVQVKDGKLWLLPGDFCKCLGYEPDFSVVNSTEAAEKDTASRKCHIDSLGGGTSISFSIDDVCLCIGFNKSVIASTIEQLSASVASNKKIPAITETEVSSSTEWPIDVESNTASDYNPISDTTVESVTYTTKPPAIIKNGVTSTTVQSTFNETDTTSTKPPGTVETEVSSSTNLPTVVETDTTYSNKSYATVKTQFTSTTKQPATIKTEDTSSTKLLTDAETASTSYTQPPSTKTPATIKTEDTSSTKLPTDAETTSYTQPPTSAGTKIVYIDNITVTENPGSSHSVAPVTTEENKHHLWSVFAIFLSSLAIGAFVVWISSMMYKHFRAATYDVRSPTQVQNIELGSS